MIEAGMEMIEAGLAELRAQTELSKAQVHIAKAETTIASLGDEDKAKLAEIKRLKAEFERAHPSIQQKGSTC